MKTHWMLEDRVAVLRPRGDLLGGPETDALVAAGKEVAAGGKPALLIDLGDVPYINSLGLSAFIRIYKAFAEQQGKVCLCNLTRRNHTVFEVVKLSLIFEIFESEREALAAFDRVTRAPA